MSMLWLDSVTGLGPNAWREKKKNFYILDSKIWNCSIWKLWYENIVDIIIIFIFVISAILFEEAILLGAESDSMLYTSDPSSPFSLPFCTLERTVSTKMLYSVSKLE